MDSRDLVLEKILNSYNKYVVKEIQRDDLKIDSADTLRKLIQREAFGEAKNFETAEQLSKRLNVLNIYQYQLNQDHSKILLPYFELIEKSYSYKIPKKKQYVFYELFNDYPKNKKIIVQLKVKEKNKISQNEFNDKFHEKLIDIDGLFKDYIDLNISVVSDKNKLTHSPSYPSDADRQKILTFIQEYGVDFIQWPPENGRLSERWTYLEEFCFRYQEFIRCYQKIVKQKVLVHCLANHR